MTEDKKSHTDYINSLSLEIKTQKDFENLLIEYENGNITRAEYICLNWMAHAQTSSNAFTKGWDMCDTRNRNKTNNK